MSAMDSASNQSAFLSDLELTDYYFEDINSEDAFHRAFLQFCADIRETDPQRLLGRFIRYHNQITDLVDALDEAAGRNRANNAGGVFWSKAFDAVRVAFETKQKDIYFRQYLPKFADLMPAFGPELSRFPKNISVQSPLQQIFAIYMHCYDLMLQNLLSVQPASAGLDSFSKHIVSVSQTILALKIEWECQVADAANEEAGTKQTHSQYSYFNGTLGPIHPHATKALFEWQETLGKGTYGQVSKVRETTTGALYAQKVIRVIDPALKRRIEKEVKNEVAIMQKLRHHHIASVQFHVFEGDTYSIIMLPVAECDLRHFLRRCAEAEYPQTDIAHLTSWFGCLISALVYAHSKFIKHEDIKPGNILIKDHQPCLADFGCAKDFSGLDSSTSMDTVTFGTPVYWAPEGPPRGRGGDVFSLGCVFSEMLTVRQKRSLAEYQAYRYVRHRDNPYAFRENVDKVHAWLDEIVPQNDSVGTLLKDQTLRC